MAAALERGQAPEPDAGVSHPSRRPRRRLLLVFDWDETITAHDTLALIPQPETGAETFAELGRAYLADLDTFRTAWEAQVASQRYGDARDGQGGGCEQEEDADEEEAGLKKAARTAGAQTPADIAELYDLPSPNQARGIPPALWTELAYLHALDAVELASVRRAEACGLFRGWDPVAARGRACDEDLVTIRDGWQDVVRWLRDWEGQETTTAVGQEADIEVHIISVSWSTTFILAGCQGHPSSRLGKTSTFPTSVSANDPEVDASTQLGTGKIVQSSLSLSPRNCKPYKDQGFTAKPNMEMRGIRTAKHKLDVLRHLLTEDGGQEDVEKISVYVGDSRTDLPALLHADVGLIMGGENASLMRALRDEEARRRLGIEVIDLAEALRRGRQEAGGGRGFGRGQGGLGHKDDLTLISVADWHEALMVFKALSV